MNSAWLYPFIICAGALQALGVVMNAQLRVALVNPWFASAVSFGPILIFFILAFIFISDAPVTMECLKAMPWWAPLGGLAGAVAVFAGLTMVDKIGAGPLNGLIITANILASLAIDHFGLLNMPPHPINGMRVIGAVLMCAGVYLISRF